MADLTVAVDGPVVRITLERPERRNAFDAALIADLTDAVRGASARPGARCIVLAGRGSAFSAGADVGWMRAAQGLDEAGNREDALRAADLFEAVARAPLPVVARVHGPALGGGAGLVCAADLAVAAEEATIGFPEVRLGIIPAVIAPYVLRRVGDGAARALFLRGRAVAAAEALRLGLVHRVVPAAELDAAVEEVVDDLLAGGPEALAACRRLLDDLPLIPPERRRAETAARIAALRVGAEAQAGLAAFLERRRPPWA